jgi:hypothetical protein
MLLKSECRPLEAALRALTAWQCDNAVRVPLENETDS